MNKMNKVDLAVTWMDADDDGECQSLPTLTTPPKNQMAKIVVVDFRCLWVPCELYTMKNCINQQMQIEIRVCL